MIYKDKHNANILRRMFSDQGDIAMEWRNIRDSMRLLSGELNGELYLNIFMFDI